MNQVEGYFLRVKGRVLGPYPKEQLQSLVQRGQLSRMHEISANGIEWTYASAFPELFQPITPATLQATAQAHAMPQPAPFEVATQAVTAPAPAYQPPAVQQPATQQPVSQPPTAATSAGDTNGGYGLVGAPVARQWYLAQGTQRVGPMDYSKLQELVQLRQVQPTDPIWNETLPAWTTAGNIPGLFPPDLRGSSQPVNQIRRPVDEGPDLSTGRKSNDVDALVIRALSQQRGVALVAAIVYFLFALELMSLTLFIASVREAVGQSASVNLFVGSLVALVTATHGACLARQFFTAGEAQFNRGPAAVVKAIGSTTLFLLVHCCTLVLGLIANLSMLALFWMTLNAVLAGRNFNP